MIHYWLRELAGWILILIGLGLFYVCAAILLHPQPRILEAPVISFCAFVIFRGGTHLLKVAVAARICLQTQAEQAKQQHVEKRKQKPDSPWDW